MRNRKPKPSPAPPGIRALTVQQPWAWAIVSAGKTIENRTQLWSYRGYLEVEIDARRVRARSTGAM